MKFPKLSELLDINQTFPRIKQYGYIQIPLNPTAALKVLESNFKKNLHKYYTPIPHEPKDMLSFRRRDLSPQYWDAHSATFQKVDPKQNVATEIKSDNAGIAKAHKLGLFDFVEDPALFELAKKLAPKGIEVRNNSKDESFVQLSRYTAGNGTSLHNDYYGTKTDPSYTLEMHFTFTKDVTNQFLLHQDGDKMDKLVNVGQDNMLGVHILPMWHQVLPLQGPKSAYRWLIIHSFGLEA